MNHDISISAGRSAPLGATPDGDGVNFAIFSANATAMTLCLFDASGHETHRVPLSERDGDIWHIHIAGITAGQLYGFRADGPYAPSEGHRFNQNKLLIDPYARRLTGQPVWNDALFGYDRLSRNDLSFDARDSAPYVPRSVVVESDAFSTDPAPLRTDDNETVFYEAHVKGLTQLHPHAAPKGKFLGLASDPILEHLTGLGVTAIELLPVQAFLNDLFLAEKGLTNYWGYQTLGFFAPDTRYLQNDDIREFQQMVTRFHAAGIEVILDVVYNHTCEGNELGPTLSFRGLDNQSYYRLDKNPRYYVNDTGTGNTVNVDHPMVMRMVMDSLRYWVTVMGVDGFRFDLCATLGRSDQGFDSGAAFFDALRQDPVLSRVKLIAEPWDIGNGGYQLGAFPPPFQEWNDKFRDVTRRFWKGDSDMTRRLADRITGSARQFDHSGRHATSSVNLVTAHDGFTLEDVVSYKKRHNKANLEDNRDGHHGNFSDNFGIEGPTEDDDILARRARRKRNMMATLLLSQGTPMILAGDELGNSQSGNNNAYCQDNQTSWINWDTADQKFAEFTRQMIAFRKSHPILRQKRFLHARERSADGVADLFWWRQDGQPMKPADWTNPARKMLCVEMRMASSTPAYAPQETAVFCVWNAGQAAPVTVPAPPAGMRWACRIDTSAYDHPLAGTPIGTNLQCPGDAIVVLVLEDAQG